MTQLKTTFAGLSLRNPIIISSSSLTNSAEKNKKLELAGASAVELCSVIYQRGNQVIADMTNEMTQWMNRQGYKDISEFKSSMNALSTGASNPFERTQFMKYFSSKE